jgi:chromosome segregation ATPase
LEKVTATLQEEVAEHVSQKKELTTLMETIATLEGDLHHSMTEESRAETELRTAKLDLQRAEQKCAALSAELNDHTQWHEQETDAGRQHQEFIEMEHESMMRTHHQQVSGDRERQDRMDKELRAGASRIVSLEEKLTQLLSEEKAAKLECEEQMSFAKELRVKKVEVELRVRELEDKRKQVAADMEREQKDLEARKAEACRMYETADERRVQLSAGADLKGQMLRDTERETRMLEESYSRAQRELEQDVREVREAAAACDSTWDADQRSRSAEKEKVTGYRDEVELTCRKAEDEHQVHLARLRAEEKRIREAGDAERSELSKRVIDLEAEASVFGREYDEQVRRINSMEETLWTLQRELETFLTAAQPAPVKRSAS